jgi:hypothetical protein
MPAASNVQLIPNVCGTMISLIMHVGLGVFPSPCASHPAWTEKKTDKEKLEKLEKLLVNTFLF